MAIETNQALTQDFDQQLSRWEHAGLITHDQSVAIHDFEAHTPKAARASLVAEVLVYLGSAAVVAAAFTLIAQRWRELGFGTKLSGAIVLAIAAGVTGAFMRTSEAPAMKRSASVIWGLSVAFAAGAGGVIAEETDPDRAWQTLLIVAGPAWVLSTIYWQRDKGAVQLLVSTAASIPMALAAADAIFGRLSTTIGGMTVAGLGAIGVFTTAMGWVPAKRTGEVLYPAMTLFGTWITVAMPDSLWAEIMGAVVSIAFLGLSVKLGSMRLLGVGGSGIFVFLTTIVLRHFSEQLGIPLALLICGVSLIGAAVVVGRLRPLVRGSASPGR